MRTPQSPRAMSGFTATEMMTVLLIVGILTAIAAPNMAAMIRNQRVKTAAFDIFASITFARSEAVKRNTFVTLTPNNAADWTRGWEIRDANNNLLKQESNRNLPPTEMTMTGPAVVTFARTGRLADAAAPTFNLVATSGSNTFARCITVDLSGRPATKEVAC